MKVIIDNKIYSTDNSELLYMHKINDRGFLEDVAFLYFYKTDKGNYFTHDSSRVYVNGGAAQKEGVIRPYEIKDFITKLSLFNVDKAIELFKEDIEKA